MPLALPFSVPVASGWQLADFGDLTLRNYSVNGPEITVLGPQLSSDELWLIDHMVVAATGLTTPFFRLFDAPESVPANYLDGIDNGTFAVADWPNGLQLRPGRQLLGSWYSTTPPIASSLIGLRLQYRKMLRVGG